jgi:hypothetical protein
MKTRAWKCLVFAVAFSSSAKAYAIEAPKCPLPPEASRSYTIAALPEVVRADFLSHIRGSIAAPGENFNPSDVTFPNSPPSRRLIEIDHFKDRWLIIYEQGGIAHFLHLVTYRISHSGNEMELLANIPEGFDAKLCKDGASLLTDGGRVRPPIWSYW